jgi:hypothetical protein
MNNKLAGLLVVLVAVLCFLTLVGLFSHGDEFEYWIAAIEDATITRDLNALGQDGWELVFARWATAGDINDPQTSLSVSAKNQFKYECIFKRKKGTLSKLGLREIPSPDLKQLSK